MLARFFIDRPIAAWVVSIVIALVGGVAVFKLPIAQYPSITPPTVQVTASYPGASAQVVVDSVGAPIEQQVNGVDHMLYMSSQSTNDGNYVLTITFDIGTDPNLNQVLVQNRVSLALPQLPPQVQLQGVSTLKTSPDILLAVNLISPPEPGYPKGRYDAIYLSNYATIHLRDELLRLNGVGQISYLGERDYSMRMWLNPDKLSTRNLTAVDVVNAIQNQNVEVAAGQVGQEPVPTGQAFQFPMSALGRLDTVREFGNIILKTGQGSRAQGNPSSQVVRVRDVARIEFGAQNYDQLATLDGQPAAGLAVFQLPGSNALDVAAAIKKKMKELSRSFPAGLEYKIVYDTTPFIRQSVDEVFNTLIIAVVLVAMVVLFFLQDWKAMILPMIDVPVSLVGTFAVMTAMGFSLNNLTLFGLVLAIGIVVDDAIIVLENIERLMATGLDARTATLKAMEEITGPIIAITLVLCAVFLPTVFIPGITGQFFRQFALTISSAMIISAVNAMTMTPSRAVSIFKTEEGKGAERKREALPWWFFGLLGGLLTIWLGNKLLAGHWGLPPATLEDDSDLAGWVPWAMRAVYFLPGAAAGGMLGWLIIQPVNALLGVIFRAFNRLFDRVTALYGWTIGRLLRGAVIVLVCYAGLLGLTYWGMGHAPTGFIPVQDQGYLLVNVQLPDAASVQRTEEVMSTLERIAHKIPGVAHTVGVAGESFLLSTNGSNLGSMFIVMDPFDERRDPGRYDAAIAQQFQQQVQAQVEEAIVGVFRAPPIHGLGNAGGFKLQTEQRGFVNLRALQESTDELVRQANASGKFAGVFTIFRANSPQIFLDIDRAKAQSLQVPLQDVFTTLQVFMGGLYVNQFNKFGRTWEVQIAADAPFRTTTRDIPRFYVRNSSSQMVPLGTLTHIAKIGGPAMIMRYNMYVSAAVNGVPRAETSSGETIDVMERLAGKMRLPIEWTEITKLEIDAGNVALLIFTLGTALVYLVLAFKYESWRLPLAVILVVPMCLLAAVSGMLIARLPVDIFVNIGFLVLVGMACKNAILIVEFAEQQRQEGKELHERTVDASRLRLRPIVMTSFAFIFGVAPLVVARGAGAEMRWSLGTAVFSGMIGVMLFGILLTPVFYFVLMSLTEGKGGKPAAKAKRD